MHLKLLLKTLSTFIFQYSWSVEFSLPSMMLLFHLWRLFTRLPHQLKIYRSFTHGHLGSMNSFRYLLIALMPTSHLRTGVRNLTSEEAGYTHALQRSDVQPTGWVPGRGGGRGGRGGRGILYAKVFVDPSFIPPAGTKCCWFQGYITVLNVETLTLRQLRKTPGNTVKLLEDVYNLRVDV